MSLGPTFIQAADDLWYREASYRGEGWFLCFDEDDPPELVVAKGGKLTAEEILEQRGIAYSHLRPHVTGLRCFDWESFGDYRPSRAYFLRITAPPPKPDQWEGDPSEKRPEEQGTYLSFARRRP